VLHAEIDSAGTLGAWTDLHRGEPGDPRGSSQNDLAAEFLGDYVYAVATRDYGAAVWNDVRNAADCPAIDRSLTRHRSSSWQQARRHTSCDDADTVSRRAFLVAALRRPRCPNEQWPRTMAGYRGLAVHLRVRSDRPPLVVIV
jgi:hypothetical protein